MNYFVIGPDGNRYGPADQATINSWVAEGRVLPETLLEEEISMRRLPARMVPGLFFEQPKTDWSKPPQAGSPYPRYGAPSVDTGQSELTAAWVLGGVNTLVCCPILPGFGLYMANKAAAKGHPGANAAKIFNLVMLIATALLYVGYLVFLFAFTPWH